MEEPNTQLSVTPFALVLDDDSTYANDGAVWVLTQSGNEKLDEDGDAKGLDVGEHVIVKISLDELLDAYNIVHGTNY